MLTLLLTTLSQSGGHSIHLNKQPYHAALVLTEICIEMRDVHRLSGTITDDKGGVLSVHVVNGTIADYKMSVAPLGHMPHGTFHNISVSYLCKGKTVSVTGRATFPPMATEIVFNAPSSAEVGVIFLKGPNPPPPPPPPPSCATTGRVNQSACDAVKPASGTGPACSWCESKDGAHKLCFVHDHKPDAADWNCDR